MNSSELILFASVVSIILAEGLDKSEINLLGNFVISVGSNLTSIAAQKETCCPAADSTNNANGSSNNADSNTEKKTDDDSETKSKDEPSDGQKSEEEKK